MATLKSETIHNITAYADACSAGFTGTYEEWCAKIANLGTSALVIPVDPDPTPTANGAVWITTADDA